MKIPSLISVMIIKNKYCSNIKGYTSIEIFSYLIRKQLLAYTTDMYHTTLEIIYNLTLSSIDA